MEAFFSTEVPSFQMTLTWANWHKTSKHSHIQEYSLLCSNCQVEITQIGINLRHQKDLCTLSPVPLDCSRSASYLLVGSPGHASRHLASRENSCFCHWFRPHNPSILHPKHQQQPLWPNASHKVLRLCSWSTQWASRSQWKGDMKL